MIGDKDVYILFVCVGLLIVISIALYRTIHK